MALPLLFVCLCALGVYLDASHHKIGKVPFVPYEDYEGRPVRKGFTNLTAAQWGFAVFFLWIVAFPLYLASRPRLLAIAAEEPRESPLHALKIAAFAAPCVGLFLLVLLVYRPQRVPACDSIRVLSIVQELVGDSVQVRLPGEVLAESVEWRRVCRVQMATAKGSTWRKFSVEPHGPDRVFIQFIPEASSTQIAR